MKTKDKCARHLRVIAITLSSAALSTHIAQGANYYWDSNGGTGLQVGSGDWDTSGGNGNRNWAPNPDGSGRGYWVNGNDAFFEASGTAIVTVIGTMQATSITFNGTGYTVAGGTVSLTGTGGNITTNASASISATLNGSVGLTKLGAGTLTLSGANIYSNGTTVSAGTLIVNNTTGSGTGTGLVSVTGGTLGGTGTISGATTISSGAIHTAGTSVTASSPTAALGKETFGGGITYNSGSIFEWNLTANTDTSIGTRGVNYDAVNTASLGVTTGAIFRVVLNGSQNFSESFWDTNRTWTNIFTDVAGTTSQSIASIFSGGVQYYNSSGVLVSPASTQGSFTLSGTSLSWDSNFTPVPEPTSALAGILLGAGLLRRKRTR